MQKNFFRKESMKQITSPDQLKDYIRVVNPSVWMILISILVFLCGVCIWGVYGQIDTTLMTVCVTENETAVCYIKEADIDKVEQGMKVLVDGKTTTIESILPDSVRVDSTFPNRLKSVGELSLNEWVYCATLHDTFECDGSISKVEILIETVTPAFFVIN